MQIPEEKITEIKNAADIVAVIGDFIPLKQAGKDYVGLCPFHNEKTPSFTVCPGKQMYFCFGCSASGDVFEFLKVFSGLSFFEAAKQLAVRYGIDLPESGAPVTRYKTPKPPKNRSQKSEVRSQNEPQKIESTAPPELWQEKAGKLVIWAHEKLLENPTQLKNLAARGIQKETVEHFRLGWNPGKDGKDLFRSRESWGLPTEMKDNRKKKLWLPIGLVIPMFDEKSIINPVHRLRIRRPTGSLPSYYIIPGSSMCTWVMQKHAHVYIIIESELDGILLWQEVRKATGIISLGSASTHPDSATIKLLEKPAPFKPLILNALDSDPAGAKALTWWDESFSRQSKRWPVPVGKDPGEAWQAGINLKEWIVSGFPSGSVGQSFFGSEKKQKTSQEEVKMKPTEKEGMVTQGEGDKVQPQANSGGLPVDSRPAVHPGVQKREKLLKQYPVQILSTKERTVIKEPLKWIEKNQEISKQISNLIFMTPEVFNYICAHPARIITGDNLIIEISG